MSSNEPKAIDVTQLNLNQLMSVKKQLDEELSHLTQSFAQLRKAQLKFNQCLLSCDYVNDENKDKKVLLPLTNSLYVPGKLTDLDSVIVDIGTGYYVKKSTKDAKTFYNNKIQYIDKNLETLSQTLEKKQDNVNVVIQIMQAKINAVIGVTEDEMLKNSKQPKIVKHHCKKSKF